MLRHLKDHEDLRPFQCQRCQATFNRRDMLNRHVSLSHDKSSRDQDGDLLMVTPVPKLTSSTIGLTLSETGATTDSTAGFTQAPVTTKFANDHIDDSSQNRAQEAYFQYFHPTWPLLHQATFQNTPQPPELMEAVLVAGLFFLSTPETLEVVRLKHSKLLADLRHLLVGSLRRTQAPLHMLKGSNKVLILVLFSSHLMDTA